MKLFCILLIALCCPLGAQEHRVLASPGGRFVFGQISVMRKDQYLLDTATGRLWEMRENSNGVRSLNPIHYTLEGNTPPLGATNQPPDMFEQMKIKADIREMLGPGYGVEFSVKTNQVIKPTP